MRSIKFDDANVNVAEKQDEYDTLPALMIRDQYGTMITKWKLTWKERVKVLFTGIIWMSEMTFKRNITPRRFSLNRKDVYLKEGEQK